MSNKPLLSNARRLEIARSVIASMSEVVENSQRRRLIDKYAALIAAWRMGLVQGRNHDGTFWIGDRDVTQELYELTGWDTRA